MFVNVLTAQDREEILQQLKMFATDETLLTALQDTFRGREFLQEMLIAVRKNKKPAPKAPVLSPSTAPPFFVGDGFVGGGIVLTVNEGAAAIALEEAKNGPPGEPAGRISKESRKTILSYLKDGPATTRDINEKLNGTLSNTGRLMKLLWGRKLVKYSDGKFTLNGAVLI